MVSRPEGGQFSGPSHADPRGGAESFIPGSIIDTYYRPGDESSVAVACRGGEDWQPSTAKVASAAHHSGLAVATSPLRQRRKLVPLPPTDGASGIPRTVCAVSTANHRFSHGVCESICRTAELAVAGGGGQRPQRGGHQHRTAQDQCGHQSCRPHRSDSPRPRSRPAARRVAGSAAAPPSGRPPTVVMASARCTAARSAYPTVPRRRSRVRRTTTGPGADSAGSPASPGRHRRWQEQPTADATSGRTLPPAHNAAKSPGHGLSGSGRPSTEPRRVRRCPGTPGRGSAALPRPPRRSASAQSSRYSPAQPSGRRRA